MDSDERGRVLRAAYSSECDAVGESNVLDILAGDVDFFEPTTGRRFEISSPIEVLANAATFISGALIAYDILCQRFARKPEHDEIFQFVMDSLSAEEKSRIIAIVLDMKVKNIQK